MEDSEGSETGRCGPGDLGVHYLLALGRVAGPSIQVWLDLR